MITAHDLAQAQEEITELEQAMRTVPTNCGHYLAQLTAEIQDLYGQIQELEAEHHRCRDLQEARAALTRLQRNAVIDQLTAYPEGN